MSNKVRVSVSISKEVVSWIDGEVEKKRFASRSHAIEYCVQQVINSDRQHRE
jgi:hypothetical protein